MQINVTDEVVLDNLYVEIVMGLNLFEQILDRFGKAGWNAYVRKLRQHNIWAMYSTPEPTEDYEHCMPVCIQIDWRGLSFQKSNLSGLDLTIPMMEKCNFNGADLSGSQIGGVEGATFRGADLRDARFEGCITGCEFTDANIKGATFNGAIYHKDDPPLGLPEVDMKSCHLYPAHWDPNENDAETPYPITPKSAELRSFWGPLPTND